MGSRNFRSESSDSLEHPLTGAMASDESIHIQVPPADLRTRKLGRVGSVLSRSSSTNMRRHNLDPFPGEPDDIVEHLDCIDEQVATMSDLTNAANSILVPSMYIYSRKPVIVLSANVNVATDLENRPITYEDSLDRHVDEILKQGKRQKFRRMLQESRFMPFAQLGLWSFLKTPLGIFVAIYGFAVVFWGAAIVLFLTKIINLHNEDRQGFWVEVSSQIVNGLFTITGVGLIPFRALDTYRISRIHYYKRRTVKLRKEARLPQLFDVNDLPDPVYNDDYVHVLTDDEQEDLRRQQAKFQKSQTWYRPHGTQTHRAFSISTALLICLLNDGNSFFQVLLCGCMWGLNRFQRPPWTTGTLIPCSFLCGIAAAIFIVLGRKKTRRTKEVQDRLRAALDDDDPNDSKQNLTFVPSVDRI